MILLFFSLLLGKLSLRLFHFLKLLVKLLFEEISNVLFEQDSDGHVGVADSFFEVFVHLLSDLHLHRVITWGDSEHVPLDLVKLGMALEVVEAG